MLPGGQQGKLMVTCMTLLIYSMGNCMHVGHDVQLRTQSANRASAT
jgi:hypothetical protein